MWLICKENIYRKNLQGKETHKINIIVMAVYIILYYIIIFKNSENYDIYFEKKTK